MSITLTIGSWIIPTLLSVFSLVLAVLFSKGESQGSYGINIMPLLYIGASIIFSLVIWLIWALLT